MSCGTGIYAQQFKQLGPAQIFEVALSAQRIQVAKNKYTKKNLDVALKRCNCSSCFGCFDLVTAINLMWKASTRDRLFGMFRSMKTCERVKISVQALIRH